MKVELAKFSLTALRRCYAVQDRHEKKTRLKALIRESHFLDNDNPSRLYRRKAGHQWEILKVREAVNQLSFHKDDSIDTVAILRKHCRTVRRAEFNTWSSIRVCPDEDDEEEQLEISLSPRPAYNLPKLVLSAPLCSEAAQALRQLLWGQGSTSTKHYFRAHRHLDGSDDACHSFCSQLQLVYQHILHLAGDNEEDAEVFLQWLYRPIFFNFRTLTRPPMAIFLLGPSGVGKSLLLEHLETYFGDAMSRLQAHSLGDRGSDSHLYDRLLLNLEEVRQLTPTQADRLKAITTQSKLDIRLLHRDSCLASNNTHVILTGESYQPLGEEEEENRRWFILHASSVPLQEPGYFERLTSIDWRVWITLFATGGGYFTPDINFNFNNRRSAAQRLRSQVVAGFLLKKLDKPKNKPRSFKKLYQQYLQVQKASSSSQETPYSSKEFGRFLEKLGKPPRTNSFVPIPTEAVQRVLAPYISS